MAHGDRILANATDPQGDGLLGWNTARYSTSMVLGSKFDEKACRFLCPKRLKKLPNHWERWQSSLDTAYRTKENGEAYAVVKTKPSAGWQVLQSRFTGYTSGAHY